jgi:uncharacterized protein with beta-barrel porin domain
VTFGSTGTFGVTLTPTTSNLLAVNGSVALGGSMTVGGTWTWANTYTVLTASNGLSGQIAAPANQGNTRFVVIDPPATIELIPLPASVAIFGTTANQRSVGGAIDTDAIAENALGPMSQLQLAIANQATGAIPGLLDIASGVGYTAFQSAAVTDTREFEQVLANRFSVPAEGGGGLQTGALSLGLVQLASNAGTAQLAALLSDASDSGGAGADPSPAGGRIWATGYGNFGTLSASNGAPGYNTSGGGVAAGVEKVLESDSVVGAAFGYDSTSITAGGLTGNASQQSYHGALYGKLTLGAGFVGASAEYGHFDGTGHRSLLTYGQTGGSLSTNGFSGQVAAGWNFTTDGYSIQPSITFQYSSLKRDSFAETGGGASALSVDQYTKDDTRGIFGVDVSHRYTDGTIGFTPVLQLGVAHEMETPTVQLTGHFLAGKTPFSVTGATPGDNAALAGALLFMDFNSALDGYFGYQGSYADNLTNHMVTGGLRLKW